MVGAGRVTAVSAVMPVILAVGGVTLLVSSIRRLCLCVAFRRRAVRCAGVVAAVRERRIPESDDRAARTEYHPILEFRTADGRTVRTEYRAGASTDEQRHRPGQAVTISYDPRDPDRAYPGDGSLALVGTALGELAGSAVLLASALYLVAR